MIRAWVAARAADQGKFSEIILREDEEEAFSSGD